MAETITAAAASSAAAPDAAAAAAEYLSRTRASYDTVAPAYAELLADALDALPLDRAMLTAFAERVGPGARVVELGCGPGHVTAHLRELRLDAFGLDLSAGMVATAAQRHPEIPFVQGSMTQLPIAEGTLGGAVAWYAIVHTPTELLPTVFAETARVLAPGAPFLLAFKAGERLHHLDHAYGHDLSLDVYWQPPTRIAALLQEAGFQLKASLTQEPSREARAAGQGQQAILLAHRV